MSIPATRWNWSSCRALATSATASKCAGRCRMAGGRWSAPSSSSIISDRCSSCPARAWTCARIRISGSPPSPICSTAASCTATARATSRKSEPGAMNLMTAGRGIAHSERTPDVQRRDGQNMLGLQSWIALPAGSEEIAPSFQHYAAAELPTCQRSRFYRTHHRRQRVRRDIAGHHGVAVVLYRSDRAGRHQACRSTPTMKSARSTWSTARSK